MLRCRTAAGAQRSLTCKLLNKTNVRYRHWNAAQVARAAHTGRWRPAIDDVERISRGESAKIRGTGSRFIPHRLNAEERVLYDQAKKKGFLSVRGTGYRKERKGHPLPNTWRQWCDARCLPCIVVEQGTGSSPDGDVVVVDLATLRSDNMQQASDQFLEIAQSFGATPLSAQQRPLFAIPFNVILHGSEEHESFTIEDEQETDTGSSTATPPISSTGLSNSINSSSDGSAATMLAPAQHQQRLAVILAAVAEQASAVRHLKEVELRNKDDVSVVRAVEELLKLKAELKLLEGVTQSDAGSSSLNLPSPSTGAAPANWREGNIREHSFTPTWQLAAHPLFFAADRSTAKQLAKKMVEHRQHC